MRIAHIVEYFMPQLGYQEYYLSKAFQELGHQVLVITSDRFYPFPDYGKFRRVLGKRIRKSGRFKENDLNLVRLPVFFEWTRPPMLLLNNLGKTVKNFSPDVVQSDGIFTPIAVQTALIRAKLDFKLFYDTHASSFNTNLDDTLPKKIFHFLFKNIAYPIVKKGSSGFIAIGESEQEMACQEYGLAKKEVPIIPLGSDTEIFKFNQKARNDLRRKLKIRDKEIVIFHGGKVNPRKDTDVLLLALSSLINKGLNVKLLVLGPVEKSYMKRLEKIVEDQNLKEKVILEDRTFEAVKEVPIFASAADLAVFPGDLAGIIQEAMSCSLPVVLPKVISKGQTSDHLLKNENGFSFERGNTKELEEKIKKLIGNEKMRKEMSKKSRELIEKTYSWQAIAKQFLKHYQK